MYSLLSKSNRQAENKQQILQIEVTRRGKGKLDGGRQDRSLYNAGYVWPLPEGQLMHMKAKNSNFDSDQTMGNVVKNACKSLRSKVLAFI